VGLLRGGVVLFNVMIRSRGSFVLFIVDWMWCFCEVLRSGLTAVGLLFAVVAAEPVSAIDSFALFAVLECLLALCV
jgi:hypothetical protein